LVTTSFVRQREPPADEGDGMTELPARADLTQLRHQAKDLLRAANSGGDTDAVARLRAVSEQPILATAQLAVAREYGFTSWPALKAEVERREILESLDVTRLRALLAAHPEQAVAPMRGWCDHRGGVRPLSYVAMMRYDTTDGIWRDLEGTGAMARALLDAGAPVEGDPSDSETPLMTSASYGDAEVAQVLIDAGADLNATVSGSKDRALRQAVVCGMDDVVGVLLAAGATDLVHAAAAGDISGMLSGETPRRDVIAALRIAAGHGQLGVIDQMLAHPTPVDGVDADGSTALHEAAFCGRADSVRHLLARGADPARRDTRFDSTPLGWSRQGREEAGPGHGHDEVEEILVGITPENP
jgi:hypothetical protein